MRKLALGCATALAVVIATPASATDFTLVVGPGVSSTNFGNSAIDSEAIDDRYFFTVDGGSTNGFVGSIALAQMLDVDLTSVLLDMTPFTQDQDGTTELWTLMPTDISSGTHFIHVIGTWGSEGGSYAGTLNFSPTPMPEPAGWATMIAGFGIIGATLRSRRRTRYRFA